jgi:hypothetical protein
MMGKGSDLNIPKDIPLPDSKKRTILEDHIKLFHMRMISGLPQRVQESINNFNVRGGNLRLVLTSTFHLLPP